MADELILKDRSSNFFDEERDVLTLIPLHKWLLISGWVLIFLVLPLLFIWSSLGIIHTPVYEQDHLFADVRPINNSV